MRKKIKKLLNGGTSLAKRKIEYAKRNRIKRKTLYSFGFEYKKECR